MRALAVNRDQGCGTRPQTESLDSRGFDSSRFLALRGGDSEAHGESPGHVESAALTLRTLGSRVDRRTLGPPLIYYIIML